MAAPATRSRRDGPRPRPKPYPTDRNDGQWELLGPLPPPAKRGDRPRTTDLRWVVNAISYPNQSSGQ